MLRIHEDYKDIVDGIYIIYDKKLNSYYAHLSNKIFKGSWISFNNNQLSINLYKKKKEVLKLVSFGEINVMY